MTPHIKANIGDIAETILLPGDPLRAKFIADTFMDSPKQFNDVRNMFGYTGNYKGKEISVMGTGMGIPSMGIYSYELIHTYGVKNLIRVGSCGSYKEEVKVRDIIFAMGACADSNYAYQYGLSGTYSAICSYELLRKATDVADKLNKDYKVGNIVSNDIFYNENQSAKNEWAKMGVLAVEMEAYGLYCNANRAGVNALAILTVSDSLVTGEKTTAQEREKTFTDMMEIALNLA